MSLELSTSLARSIIKIWVSKCQKYTRYFTPFWRLENYITHEFVYRLQQSDDFKPYWVGKDYIFVFGQRFSNSLPDCSPEAGGLLPSPAPPSLLRVPVLKSRAPDIAMFETTQLLSLMLRKLLEGFIFGCEVGRVLLGVASGLEDGYVVSRIGFERWGEEFPDPGSESWEASAVATIPIIQ